MEQQGAPGWMIDTIVGLEGVKGVGGAAEISPVVAEVLGRAPQTSRAFVSKHRDALTS
ncbi:MAG: hypothetical protein AAGF11_30855 [Myxococcota bacterium]